MFSCWACHSFSFHGLEMGFQAYRPKLHFNALVKTTYFIKNVTGKKQL